MSNITEVYIDGVLYAPVTELAGAGTPDAPDWMAALDLRIPKSDAGNNITIREYLCQLLTTLWRKGEGFSGKRPFGNSGWEFCIYESLVRAGLVQGGLDADGYLGDFDREAAEQAGFELIAAAFYGVKPAGAEG